MDFASPNELVQYKSLISNFAIIITVLQFLSGVLVCKQYVTNKTTAESSPLPFICGFFSTGIWLLYGLLKHDDNIVLVNVIGLTLMVSYTIVFYIFTIRKTSVVKTVAVTLLLYIFILGYAGVESNAQILLGRIGLLACSFTVLTIAAPLSKLHYVIKMKNTECLPFPMILMSLFVSLLWFFYGIIIQDKYLVMPNFMGAVLASIQLSLFAIFPSNSSSKIRNKTLLA